MRDVDDCLKKFNWYGRLIVFCLCVSMFTVLPEFLSAEENDFDRFIVAFHETVTDSRELSDQLASRFGFALDHVYTTALRGFAARLSPRHREFLGSLPSVRYIVPDRVLSIPLPPLDGVTPKVRLPEQVVPSGVDRIDADLNANAGADIDVAVLDSGIDLDHPDLVDNIGGGIGFIGNTTGQDDNIFPFGVWGHGTHVAGVIAATDNNFGVVGVAPKARLWAVKVCNWIGLCTNSAIIAGLDWVAESHTDPAREPIEVVNMSLGGPGQDDGNCGFDNNDPQHQAICTLVNEFGVTVVVAAGNEAQDVANVVPASYDEVITVSAIDDAGDTFAAFSNFGEDVDITAPGVDILSTALQPRLLGQYSELSGTSFSSPHVAGAAALMIRTVIDALGSPPTPQQVREVLILLGESAPSGGWPGDPDGIDEPLVDAENL